MTSQSMSLPTHLRSSHHILRSTASSAEKVLLNNLRLNQPILCAQSTCLLADTTTRRYTCTSIILTTDRVAELTPWSWVLLVKPPVAQLLKNFPAFAGTRMFIIVLTRVVPILSQINPVHTTPSYLSKINFNITVTWQYSLRREATRYYATAGKQQTTVGFRGNRYTHNMRGTVGNGDFYWVHPETI
jgi:hypothetical protein